MGPISVDGLGQNNPVRSEGPWGGVEPYSNGGTPSSLRPDTERGTESDYEVREGWMQTEYQLVNAGSRLKPPIRREGTV